MLYAFLSLLLLSFPRGSWALESLDKLGQEILKDTPNANALEELSERVGIIIQAMLPYLSLFFFILIVYAGALWMFAGGDSTKVDKAKKVIRGAVIALVIITSAYVVTLFIINTLG